MRALLVLPLALAAAACSSDPPPKKSTSVAEARDPEVVRAVRAPATMPAPAPTSADAGPAEPAPAPEGNSRGLQAILYDRVLARAKTTPVDVEALKAELEAATGARVEKIRKGAIGILSIQFAPTDPPRDAAAQKKLVAACEATGLFKYAEPEKLMKAK